MHEACPKFEYFMLGGLCNLLDSGRIEDHECFGPDKYGDWDASDEWAYRAKGGKK